MPVSTFSSRITRLVDTSQQLVCGFRSTSGQVNWVFVSRLFEAGELEATHLDSSWSTDEEHGIDIGGMRSRLTFVGKVKWRAALLGRGVYSNLADHAHALRVDDLIPWIVVGPGGVERSLLQAMLYFRGFSHSI